MLGGSPDKAGFYNEDCSELICKGVSRIQEAAHQLEQGTMPFNVFKLIAEHVETFLEVYKLSEPTNVLPLEQIIPVRKTEYDTYIDKRMCLATFVQCCTNLKSGKAIIRKNMKTKYLKPFNLLVSFDLGLC